MKNIKFMILAVAATTAALPATATHLNILGTCYQREYSGAHLQKQPNQNVATLALRINRENDTVVLSGTNRAGEFGYMQFSCDVGHATSHAIDCGTYESESQISITPRRDASILIATRNTFLSDIGGEYEDDGNQDSHYAFYLEEGPHSPFMGVGPYFSFKLYPAPAARCPIIK